jgi:hypothetical protein
MQHNGNGNGEIIGPAEPSEQDFAILDERIRGAGTHSIAKKMRLKVAEVNAALDRALTPIVDEDPRRAFHLELARLEKMMSAHIEKALAGNVDHGAFVLRVCERVAALRGWDVAAQFRQSPTLRHLEAEKEREPTSTERIRAALDRIAQGRAGGPDPEAPPSTTPH